MKCFSCKQECQKEDKAPLFGSNCDSCNRIVCKNCAGRKAGLLSNEVRAVLQTSGRTLFYFCCECTNAMLSINFIDLKNTIDTMTSKITNMETELSQLKKQLQKVSNNKTESTPNNTKEIIDCMQSSIQKQSELMGAQLRTAIMEMHDSQQNMIRELKDMVQQKSRDHPGKTSLASAKQKKLTELEAATAKKMNEVINLCSNEDKGNYFGNLNQKPNLDQVRRTGIRGTNTSVSNLVAACERRVFYIDNLEPSTSTDQLKIFFKQENLPILSCEKVNIKDQNKAAFKVAVDPQYEEQILVSTRWPVNVGVKPFITNWRRNNGSLKHQNIRNQNFMGRDRRQWHH